MNRFSPDTRNLGGRHLVSKIITNHQQTIKNISTSYSATFSAPASRSHFYPSTSPKSPKKTVMLKRKLSTDCYEPATFALIPKISRNKKKRKNFQILKHEAELKILKRKVRKMSFSWFSISEFVLNNP